MWEDGVVVVLFLLLLPVQKAPSYLICKLCRYNLLSPFNSTREEGAFHYKTLLTSYHLPLSKEAEEEKDGDKEVMRC